MQRCKGGNEDLKIDKFLHYYYYVSIILKVNEGLTKEFLTDRFFIILHSHNYMSLTIKGNGDSLIILSCKIK